MRMKRLAREQGIEPQFTVLETVVLAIDTIPLYFIRVRHLDHFRPVGLSYH